MSAVDAPRPYKFGGEHLATCRCPVCGADGGKHRSTCQCPNCHLYGGAHVRTCRCDECGANGGKHVSTCACPLVAVRCAAATAENIDQHVNAPTAIFTVARTYAHVGVTNVAQMEASTFPLALVPLSLSGVRRRRRKTSINMSMPQLPSLRWRARTHMSV